MTNAETVAVIEVKIVNEGGLLTVESNDVPGLHLAGYDIHKIAANIIPAIQRLFKDNRNLDVEIRPASTAHTFPVPADILSGKYVMYGKAAA